MSGTHYILGDIRQNLGCAAPSNWELRGLATANQFTCIRCVVAKQETDRLGNIIDDDNICDQLSSQILMTNHYISSVYCSIKKL